LVSVDSQPIFGFSLDFGRFAVIIDSVEEVSLLQGEKIMPRITGEHFQQLKNVLRKALEDECEVSFTYHDAPRSGTLTDFGFGPQGSFITIAGDAINAPDEKVTSHKSFSIAKMSNLRVLQPA
jgi:hypothetical protein